MGGIRVLEERLFLNTSTRCPAKSWCSSCTMPGRTGVLQGSESVGSFRRSLWIGAQSSRVRNGNTRGRVCPCANRHSALDGFGCEMFVTGRRSVGLGRIPRIEDADTLPFLSPGSVGSGLGFGRYGGRCWKLPR